MNDASKTDSTEDEAADLADFLGAGQPQFVSSPTRQVKPWHKPRKHWVREEQWDKNCRQLIASHLGGDAEFKYLSLPGPDMLDVRFMAQTCQQLNRKLRFLGFNNPSDESEEDRGLVTKNVAEICLSSHVSEFSSVVPDRLENLAAPKSVANQTLAEFGSLDAINLDLCNSMLGHIPLDQQSTYYDAIHALFEHQKSTRAKPFLLFLTTRTERSTMKESAVARLASAVRENLQNNDFKMRLNAKQNIKAFEIQNFIDSKRWPTNWNQRKISRFVTIALSKWLLSLLWDGHPSWEIKVVDSCEYRVSADRDMLSISFLCLPVRKTATDGSGLSKLEATRATVTSERECGMEILNKLEETFDLDARLRSDSKYGLLVERAAKLMASAGYDADAYRERYSQPS